MPNIPVSFLQHLKSTHTHTHTHAHTHTCTHTITVRLALDKQLFLFYYRSLAKDCMYWMITWTHTQAHTHLASAPCTHYPTGTEDLGIDPGFSVSLPFGLSALLPSNLSHFLNMAREGVVVIPPFLPAVDQLASVCTGFQSGRFLKVHLMWWHLWRPWSSMALATCLVWWFSLDKSPHRFWFDIWYFHWTIHPTHHWCNSLYTPSKSGNSFVF